jgi:Citrate synthase, C-terminal domain
MGEGSGHIAERAAPVRDDDSPCLTVSFKERHVRVPLERTETDVFVRAALLPLRVFDPHVYHTAACISAVSRADSTAGKLYFRGYDMEELAARSNFLEVAYLLIYGRGLPTPEEADAWTSQVLSHANLHEDIRNQLRTFRYDVRFCEQVC